jgi:UDP-N-acetylmuramoyl-tripeptide--D-alanyl-D-alanine ligase
VKPLTLQDVRRVVAGKSTGPLPAIGPVVTAVCTDTRQMKADSLFVALKGDRFDGHAFLDTAAASGAIAAVVSQIPPAPPRGMRLVVVPDTRIALGKLARTVRMGLRSKVIAVAGSNGKTSTKYLIDAVLRVKLKGSFSPKSFNNDIGVPLTIFPADDRQDYLVLELGTNHPGEIANLTKIAQPDIAVITNCGEEHLEFLGDVAGVRRENASVIEGLNPKGLLVVNGDDPELLAAVGDYQGKRITFGFQETNDLFATEIQCDGSGTRFKLNGRALIFVPLLGRHTAANALAAIAVGKRLRLTEDEIVAGLAIAQGPEMRLQLQKIGAFTLLNDAYNANPPSMKAALQTLGSLEGKGRRIAILGDMRELGPAGEGLHRDVGAFAAAAGLDRLACVGTQGHLIAEAARAAGMPADRIELYPDAEAAARHVPQQINRDDVVLLKASRSVHLEIVAKALVAQSARM